MNNFASQLGKLQQAASKAAKAQQQPTEHKHPLPASGHKDEHQKSSKRRRQNDPPNNTQKDDNVRPHDIRELRIEISFLCIGAQKAGTTWLHEILQRHPHLSLPKQKEVHFWDWNRRKGLGWYSRQFPPPGDGGVRGKAVPTRLRMGEITPCYIALHERAVREIHHLFPRLRIVFVARDLVDRAWSALLMELRNQVRGLSAGTFHDADRAVGASGAQDDDPRRRKEEEKYRRDADPANYKDEYFMERLRHATHTDRSDYATRLRLWIAFFPKDSLLLLDYNDITERPRDFVRSVCRHIDVESDFFVGDASTDGLLGNDVLQARVNSATGGAHSKPYGSLRPSLRRKMEDYLRPFSKDFNSLLHELGYSWRIDEFDSSKAHTK